MTDLLMKLIDFHTTHFQLWEAQAKYAAIYGWLATASAIVAILTFFFVVFRREAGKVTAITIAQYFLVWGIPLYTPSLLALLKATTNGG